MLSLNIKVMFFEGILTDVEKKGALTILKNLNFLHISVTVL